MKNDNDRWRRKRIFLIFFFFIVFFGAIIVKAFYLQVVEAEHLKGLARNQSERVVKIPSKRAGIFDRNHEELAVSIEVDSVYAHPRYVEDHVGVSKTLSPLLSLESGALRRRLSSDKPFVWFKRQVDLSTADRELISGIKGVGTVKEMKRFYPNRSLGANLIGFVGMDSNGLEGVELYYDRYLSGMPVTLMVERDAKGKLLVFEDVEDDVKGMDVSLTIDKNIQYIAEKAVKNAIERFSAKAGIAIVMDPSTGEVLAMANIPSFDPNNFSMFRPFQWRNRAITDTFEPGSTIKAFLLAAIIEEGIISPEDVFFCENGSYRVLDRTFHDTKKYGWLTVKDIIKYSSNIGAAKIGEKLGKRRYYWYLNEFGLGQKTGMDFSGEPNGSLIHYAKWSPVMLDTISFGQGISVTPIQLITAFSSIANGGFILKPHVIKHITNSDGDIIEEFNPAVIRRVISKGTADMVRDALIRVTEKGGTGELASIGEGFAVAGKTGTAQKPDLKEGGYEEGKYIASFIGFVPAHDPRLSILVIIDEPFGGLSGGVVAAPIFREIARETLAYLGIFPKDAGEWIKTIETRGKGERLVTVDARDGYASPPSMVPDFRGKTIRTALRMAREGSFEVDIKGSGKAISQYPGAGTVIPEGRNVKVVFQ